MKKTVLIHCGMDDVHAESVARCLRELDVDVFLAYREKCFDEWSISCLDDDIIVETPDRTLNSEQILTVYWRLDYILEPSWVRWDGITPQVAEFIADQRSMHVESAFRRLSESCRFVNSIDANRRCSSKALQHHVARKCGLSVPKTYMGSNPAEAEKFVQRLWEQGKMCCTKNIESTHVEIGSVKHARLTKLFTPENISDLKGLPPCPLIFQEYIEKRFEYRVTVVEEEVFACRIDSQAAGGKTAVDWRNYDIPSTPHHAMPLDEELAGQLVELVRRLGLTYGAIDLVEGKDGVFYFLEVNSMGQWLWIEDLTELPISASIARHLANPQPLPLMHQSIQI